MLYRMRDMRDVGCKRTDFKYFDFGTLVESQLVCFRIGIGANIDYRDLANCP